MRWIQKLRVIQQNQPQSGYSCCNAVPIPGTTQRLLSLQSLSPFSLPLPVIVLRISPSGCNKTLCGV